MVNRPNGHVPKYAIEIIYADLVSVVVGFGGHRTHSEASGRPGEVRFALARQIGFDVYLEHHQQRSLKCLNAFSTNYVKKSAHDNM